MEPTGHPPVGGQAPQSARVARAVLVSPAAVNGHRRPRGAAESRTEQPMVLVPAGEREALLRFAAQLQERTVAPDSLLVADPLRELPPVEPVRIEPLEIAPLTEAGKS